MANKYKKCPRCELNYILADEDLCPICKQELKLAPSEDDLEYCPLCGKNLITVDQVMCDECAKKRNLDDVVDEQVDGEEPESANDSQWDEPAPNGSDFDQSVESDAEIVSFSDLDDDDEDDDFDDTDDDEVEDDQYHGETDDDDFEIPEIDDSDFTDEDDDDDDSDDYDDDDDDFLHRKKK